MRSAMTGRLLAVPPAPTMRASSDRDVLAPACPPAPDVCSAREARVRGIGTNRDERRGRAVLAGSRKFPTNVCPARSRMVSPGCAASMADWRSEYVQPLAQTVMVAAPAIAGSARRALTINTTRRTTTKKQTGADDVKTTIDLLNGRLDSGDRGSGPKPSKLRATDVTSRRFQSNPNDPTRLTSNLSSNATLPFAQIAWLHYVSEENRYGWVVVIHDIRLDQGLDQAVRPIYV